MLRLAALLVATYVGAFVLTSAVTSPHELRTGWARLAGATQSLVSLPARAEAKAEVSGRATGGARKSAALARPSGQPAHPLDLATSEIVLLAGGALALLDAEGRIVLRHDPAGRTTTIARGTSLPRLLAAPAGDAPRLPGPLPRREVDPPREVDAPEVDGPDETLAVGCESPVSPLAGGGRAVSARALCLASL
ncbi:hypothetical protein ACTZWW_08235 [Salinarimonas sp. NSM]|uniref:hypothetical protein n=1 Tax=Salinarimonas sp. NSM TaxID=3458003 RepID=UPI0040359817